MEARLGLVMVISAQEGRGGHGDQGLFGGGERCGGWEENRIRGLVLDSIDWRQK